MARGALFPTAFLSVFLSFDAQPAAFAAEPVTTGTLLAEMHDLERLARLPDPPYKLIQYSSYDRRSNLPGGPDWFANRDGFGGETIPGFEGVVKPPGDDGVGEYLVCDVQQPGAIVRTWTAAIEGQVRMYLDDAAEPVFDGPAEEFFMRRHERYLKNAGFDARKTGDAFRQFYANYFPMPFARRCKIVWIGDLKKVHFYQVQVRHYPPHANVLTFKPDDVKTHGENLARACDALNKPPAAAPSANLVGGEHALAAGETKQLFNVSGGPGAIRVLEVQAKAEDLPRALRSIVLRVHFDGAQTPQVRAPLGDFFSAAPGIVPHETLPFRVEANGRMICRFVMPYAETAVGYADNRGDQAATLKLNVAVAPRKWDERSLHFYARWRVNHDLLARPGADVIDLPFVLARGRGQYVGTAVYIMNPCPVPTAGGNWWGEGDEKIFVDDDRLPSTFGTGSEDYFNYAWSRSDIFDYPYFAQPNCTGPDTRGYVTNSRWHVLDAIPFENFLAFYMELWPHRATPHLSYARLSYFYARPGVLDDHVPPQDADLRVPPLPSWRPVAEGGATGATFFEAEDILSGVNGVRLVADPQYSGGKLVVWQPQSGTPLPTLRLKVKDAGKYHVVLTCLSGPTAVAFRPALNGAPLSYGGGKFSDDPAEIQKAEESANTSEEKKPENTPAGAADANSAAGGDAPTVRLRTPSGPRLMNVWSEPVELKAGEHTLSLDALTGPVSVDFVWLKPAR